MYKYSFISLYIIGSYLNIYSNDFKKYKKQKYIYIFILTSCISFLLRFSVNYIKHTLTGIRFFENGMFVSYISPLFVIGAISLVIYFSNLNFNTFKSYIIKISSLSFGVYLTSPTE